MNTKSFIIFLAYLAFSSCNESSKPIPSPKNEGNIICSGELCQGIYSGPEFVNGSDIAHQFSNEMSATVGDKLKELYDKKKYSKIDFSNIYMTTMGMGSGNVVYELRIPIIPVKSKCESYTSFDHVGGWNHVPELEKRKNQLENVLLAGDQLDISSLKTTKEGLQEYWIQWRNKEKQKDCISIK